MKRGLILLVGGAVLSLAVVLVVRAKSGQGKQYQPGDVVDGRHSNIATHEYHLVTNQEQWRVVWTRHRVTSDAGQADGALPDVDFSRHMVVAILLGDISQCTGITVQGTAYKKTDDHLDIRYRPDWYSAEYESEEDLERNPEKYRREHAATPFGFIVVRRAAKVSIFEDVQTLRGADPKYELQAELSKDSPVFRPGPR